MLLILSVFAVVFSTVDVEAAKISRKAAKDFFEVFALITDTSQFHSPLKGTKGFDKHDCWKGADEDWDDFKIKEIDYDEEEDLSFVSGYFYSNDKKDDHLYCFGMVKEKNKWVILVVVRSHGDEEEVYNYNFKKARYELVEDDE